jgi:hypothetical protein
MRLVLQDEEENVIDLFPIAMAGSSKAFVLRREYDGQRVDNYYLDYLTVCVSTRLAEEEEEELC